MSRTRKLWLAGALGLAVACGGRNDSPQSSSKLPAAFSEHHAALLGGSGTGPVGANCAAHGGGDCVSQLCLHASVSPRRGYVCTQRCTSRRDCPAGWNCLAVHPPSRERFCAPGR